MSLSTNTVSIPLAVDSDGVVRFDKTRVTLDTVLAAFRAGATAEEIVQQYPSLLLADVYSVISYILQNVEEVDAYLEDRQKHSDAVRLENERRFDPHGIRDRLLARRRTTD